MERILLAGDYPNLTYLELFDFRQELMFNNVTDDSVFRSIFKDRITDLILHNNDEYINEELSKTYTKNIYAHIMVLFQNLKHLTIATPSVNEYPFLSLKNLPSTTFFSTTLTVLCLNVMCFDDCLYLLDDCLPQLTTFIVQIHDLSFSSLMSANMVS
ncbi:unnamed protein product [Rotaria sp. Silwood2]|nr:unnamed protein product [Rotaria sp. Silwood2]